MHHSGCTPRQPTPFEIRTMRPTISRSPKGRSESVRWLAHDWPREHPRHTHIDFACYRGISPLRVWTALEGSLQGNYSPY